eukprot:scaffold1692_cov74-Skeletonema_menzelii.AAC.8
MSEEEANLIIKLIQEAPNGYVPLDQLKKQYHEFYGKHLERKKIGKWIRTLPGIHINNDPVKDSIHALHKKDDTEAELVIKLIQYDPNGYVPLDQLKMKYYEKYGKHLERKKILKWIRSLPGIYIDNSPVTLSIHFRVDAGLACFSVAEGVQSMERSYAAVVKRKKEEKKRKHKKTKGNNPSANLTTPTPKKTKQKKGKKCKAGHTNECKARVESFHPCLKLPIRNDCYYGMANHQVDTHESRKCIMHFGSTSDCKKKYWPGKGEKQLHRVSKAGPVSRAIVSGYIANKIKKAGRQKAARKTRNLARLRKKHNPMPAVPSSHAKQRYKERGLGSSPIYESLKDGKEAIVLTYVPIQRSVCLDAKNSRRTIQLEVDRMSKLSSDLPKSKLSARDAYLFKLSSQAAKKEEYRRRSQQKEKAYSKQCSYPLDESWTPLSMNIKAPQTLRIHARRNNWRRHKSTPWWSKKKRAQKKKSNVTGRAH